MMDEGRRVVLGGGREVVLEDEDDILLSVISDGETKFTFSVPYPEGGYGGGMLFLSESEQYLVFSYFSGQSEEAFLLFRIDGCNLEPIYHSEYCYGEDGNYYFSREEDFLVQTLRTGWWSWFEEEAQTDSEGNPCYEFGLIQILDITKRELSRHVIHVYPSGDWEEETDVGPFQISEIINDNTINITMPWGEEKFTFPFGDVIVVKPK